MLTFMRALVPVVALFAAWVPASLALAQDHAPEESHAPGGLGVGEDAVHGTGAGEHDQPSVLPGVREGLAAGLTSLVVFGLVLVVLGRVVWPRIVAGLDEREGRIRSEIRAAEEARRQSREALEQYERSLQEAKAEARRMLEEAKAQQQELSAELRAKADVELSAMKDRARRDIENARKAALSDIYEHAASLATTMAAKILAREIHASADDQQRLLDEALGELGTAESVQTN